MHKLRPVLVLFAFLLAAAVVPAFAQPAQADVSAAKAAKTGLLGGKVQLEYIYMDDANTTEYTILPKADIDEVRDREVRLEGPASRAPTSAYESAATCVTRARMGIVLRTEVLGRCARNVFKSLQYAKPRCRILCSCRYWLDRTSLTTARSW